LFPTFNIQSVDILTSDYFVGPVTKICKLADGWLKKSPFNRWEKVTVEMFFALIFTLY